MVFSSVSFLFYFLPIVIIVYNLAPCRLRNAVLLVSSLFFYAWGEPAYVFLMILSIVFNYVMGRAVASAENNEKPKEPAVVIAIIVNIGLLGFFKYADFLMENINGIFGTDIAALKLPLPIGISFYTFQALSYIIDLYRGQVKLQRNIIDFGTYVALFPQLIAGPIVRIKSIQEQLENRPRDIQQFSSGIGRFTVGFAKKVLIANNMGLLWNSALIAMNDGNLTVMTAWMGAIAFTFQIYFDFSGYSDMAIGIGRMFGFEFPENFNYPYISSSITEFWRRWHISLSSWFKEYLYIPLGGNKKGFPKQIRNILIVWLLTGLWHGASWNFVIWGLYFGVILITEKLFLGEVIERLPKAAAHIYTMVLVIFSWVIFACEDLTMTSEYIGHMLGFKGAGIADEFSIYLLMGNGALLLFGIIGSLPLPKKLWKDLVLKLGGEHSAPETVVRLAIIVLGLFVSVAFMVTSTYNPFLYFRF